MSEIVYTCECGKVYRFNSRFAGRASRCMVCKRKYIVPPQPENDDDFELAENIVPIAPSPSAPSVYPASPVSSAPPASPSVAVSPASPVSSSREAGADSDSGESSRKTTEPTLPQHVVPQRIAQMRRSSSHEISQVTEEPEDIDLDSLSLSSVSEEQPTAPSGPKEPEVLGPYEILERIGGGGMGDIYAAWDPHLQREVTLKRMNAKSQGYEKNRDRFIHEARVTGKLIHPGIVPVYLLDFDAEESPFYTMRLLEGRTLEQLVRQHHDAALFADIHLRDLLRYFVEVCHIVAFAHAHGVIHRDIKPANIMLGGYGEVFLLDWGLAKSTSIQDESEQIHSADGQEEERDDGIEMTMVGARVGTRGYQAPDYLHSGKSRFSDDIYALGATLYMILCGRLPYDLPKGSAGYYEMMSVPPKLPHLLNMRIDRPLSAVCLAALAFDRDRRYPTPGRLADDVQRWLDGEAVSVYRMSGVEKWRHYFRTKKRAVAGSAFVIAALSFGLGALFGRLFFQ